MEMETIKALITAFKEAELTSLSLKCEGFELELGKEVTMQAAPVNVAPHYVAPVVNQVVIDESETTQVVAKQAALKSIKAPIVGTFYSATSPGAEPFVTVGSKVKKGDVVCVVEAMKLMNEVEAEEDGEVIEILVQNEEMVEYGQPLFRLK